MGFLSPLNDSSAQLLAGKRRRTTDHPTGSVAQIASKAAGLIAMRTMRLVGRSAKSVSLVPHGFEKSARLWHEAGAMSTSGNAASAPNRYLSLSHGASWLPSLAWR